MEYPDKNRLVSYQGLLEFLKKKGKDKIWFDTLRTRHKLIHKPIVTSPVNLISKETGLRFRKGRSVYYLRAIIPFLERIIDLHDNKSMAYEDIKKEMKDSYEKLIKLRAIELYENNRLKPDEFYNLFYVAKKKLKKFYKWNDNAEELKFMKYLEKKISNLTLRYFSLAIGMHNIIKDNVNFKSNEHKLEEIGQEIDYINENINTSIQHMIILIRCKKIKLNEKDWEAINNKIE